MTSLLQSGEVCVQGQESTKLNSFLNVTIFVVFTILPALKSKVIITAILRFFLGGDHKGIKVCTMYSLLVFQHGLVEGRDHKAMCSLLILLYCLVEGRDHMVCTVYYSISTVKQKGGIIKVCIDNYSTVGTVQQRGGKYAIFLLLINYQFKHTWYKCGALSALLIFLFVITIL